MSGKTVLEYCNLSVGYGQHCVVRAGLNGALRSGELVALIGRNGSGKSTLLRTLAGLQSPLGGSVTYCGVPVADLSPRELARSVAVVLTAHPDTQMLTVGEVVETGRIPYTGFLGRLREKDRSVVRDALERLNLTSLASRRLASLSDGERQRAMLAKAVAQQTPVVILDEPTAFLDYVARPETLRLLAALAHVEGKAILLSTHEVELAREECDRVVEIAGSSAERLQGSVGQ